LLHPEFVRRTGLQASLEAAVALRDEPLPTERANHHRELESGIIPTAMEVFARGVGAFGIAAGFPFLDRRLVELCLALPSEQKFGQGWNRLIVRRAMAGLIPEKVRWRTDKGNVGFNFLHGLRTHNRDLIEAVILSDGGRLWEFVDRAVLRRLYEACQRHGLHPRAHLLVMAVTLALWLERPGRGAGA
jgi:asparagine synthase (glutamine-hydrolysing)